MLVRVRLARLSERYAPEKLSSAQRDLLVSAIAEQDVTRQPSAELDGFAANAQEMERACEDGVYAELTSQQQAWVATPSTHPALSDDVRYPLTLEQLHLLTGASAQQTAALGRGRIVPWHRVAGDHRFCSAAVVHALLLTYGVET